MSPTPDANSIPPERIADWKYQCGMMIVMLCVGLGAAMTLETEIESRQSTGLWIALGLIGIWRWGWGLLHCVRAIIYRYIVYPRWAAAARRAVQAQGGVTDVVVLATTYRERSAITRAVIWAVVKEFGQLTGLKRSPRLVFVTGSPEDDVAVEREFRTAVDSERDAWTINGAPELVLLRGDCGKRPAIASGLKHIAAMGVDPDGVVVLMDGDSAPDLGAFAKVLPMFRLDLKVGAVTTNECAVIEAPMWYTEWIKLRFGQRHLYMCSVSLSKHLLCLTGRFSVFRADVVTSERFIEQIESDNLHNWLFGEYQMFSGDDKSSWYWLSANGYQTLYVPDAMVTTYEAVNENPFHRAVANLKRWSGNMLRNSGRAMSLGPQRLGLFPWLCCVDQKISFWTVLIGPTGMLLSIWHGRWGITASYVLWLLATRTFRVASAWKHSRRISLWYIPLQVASEWVGAAVKVWVVFHPVKQTWLNRGNRTLDSSRSVPFAGLRRRLATFYCCVAVTAFVLSVGAVTQFIPFLHELPLITTKRASLELAVHLEPELLESKLFFGARPIAEHDASAVHSLETSAITFRNPQELNR
ncbi:MAG: glycosyltransferase [Planctomycetia bacterium]|nr:glycosyltransferase [Planctomycetia bacterium]